MAVGEDWGPEDLTGAHPAILKKKQKGKKEREGERGKCFVRRARGIPWAVSLNKPGVKHPPAPTTPPLLARSLHLPPLPPPPFSLQSDRGIIVPQGFRWFDISVTWRRAVSYSPEEPRLPAGRGDSDRENDVGWLALFVDFCHRGDAL